MFTVASGARDTHVMAVEDAQRSQRPYRYGIILLCCGALVNWLGLTENYGLPIRYLGISCIICGAILICSAMCCWFSHPPSGTMDGDNDNSIHVISMPGSTSTIEKPPAYEAVIIEPPTYDDAIKLNPALLIQAKTVTTESERAYGQNNTTISMASTNTCNLSQPVQGCSQSAIIVTEDKPVAETQSHQKIIR